VDDEDDADDDEDDINDDEEDDVDNVEDGKVDDNEAEVPWVTTAAFAARRVPASLPIDCCTSCLAFFWKGCLEEKFCFASSAADGIRFANDIVPLNPRSFLPAFLATRFFLTLDAFLLF
jgi:hypothetical protein